MLSLVVIFVCSLFSNTISQLIPLRFDQAIERLNDYRRISPDDLMKNLEYNLTPEKIFEYINSSKFNNQTSLCEEQFDLILNSVTKGDLWAVKILDAWGKPLPSGVLKGNVYWVGDYDECLQPWYYPGNKTYISQPFETQHC